MFNEFTAGIVAYLHDKNKVEEEDVLPGTGALEKKDQLVDLRTLYGDLTS